MNRRLARLLVPLLTCTLLPAQAGSVAEIAALLAAESPQQVAHGAAVAARRGDREVLSALRVGLDKWTRSTAAEAIYVRHYLLDALIRLEVVLPGEVIAPHLEGRLETLALILMARAPEANGSLLFALLQKHWQNGDANLRLAAGNLLAATQYRGFAAWLMPRLPLRLLVTVRDHDTAAIGVGSGGARGSIQTRAVALPDSWPPLPRYELTTQAESFLTLLAPGPRPVFMRRSEDQRRVYRLATASSTIIDPGPSAHEWLLHMARADPQRLGLPLCRIELVRWRGVDGYVTTVEGYRAEIAAAWRDLGRHLVARRAITVDEIAGLALPLRLEIRDERRERSVALPDLERR